MVDKQNDDSAVETVDGIEDIAIATNQWKEERWQDENANDNNSLIIEELAFINTTCTTIETASVNGSCHSLPPNDGVELVQINIIPNEMNNDREIEENDNNRNTIQDDTGVASGSGTASSSSESHLHNDPEDDDSKDNYDMEEEEEMMAHENNEYDDDDDADNADETHVLVCRKQLNDLEDCDYYSDGDGIDDEREEILKCNGDGIIANLFAGLYSHWNSVNLLLFFFLHFRIMLDSCMVYLHAHIHSAHPFCKYSRNDFEFVKIDLHSPRLTNTHTLLFFTFKFFIQTLYIPYTHWLISHTLRLFALATRTV